MHMYVVNISQVTMESLSATIMYCNCHPSSIESFCQVDQQLGYLIWIARISQFPIVATVRGAALLLSRTGNR